MKILLTLALAVGVILLAGGPATAQQESAAVSNSLESLEPAVQEHVEGNISGKRDLLLKEAVEALDQTEAALAALNDGRIDDALDALALVAGKLELVVARDPDLALAPIDVTMEVHDLFATKDHIKKAIGEAEDLIEKRRIQEARRLLAGLGSEIVLSVSNLPLATYPDAIREIAPLVDAGEIEAAKVALVAALDTIVVTKHTLALPVIRAQVLLDAAQEILDNTSASIQAKRSLPSLIERAQEQFEMAELLGYVEPEDLEDLRKEWAHIASQVTGGEPEKGVLSKMQKSLAGMRKKLFG